VLGRRLEWGIQHLHSVSLDEGEEKGAGGKAKVQAARVRAVSVL
jgi:hypothetical protein